MKKWWSDKAKPWLKKNWKWILLPVGILLLVAKFWPSRRTLQASSELQGAAKVEREATEKAEAEIAEATAEQKNALKLVEEEHAEVVKELTDDQKSRVEGLRDNPEDLNDFLKGVGKNIRRRNR